MDGILKSDKKITIKFRTWLANKLANHVGNSNFYEDIHIDMLLKIKSKEEWLYKSFDLFYLLYNYILSQMTNLDLGLCFTLSTTYKESIPKTFTKRNFSKNMITPPEIMVFSTDYKPCLLKGCVFLPVISEKYNLKAFYREIKDDGVIYRWIYFLK
jgi:hypothetical protein